MVYQAVDHGRRNNVVGKGLSPVTKRKLARQPDAGSFFAFGDDREQQFCSARVGLDVAKLIEEQQTETTVAGHYPDGAITRPGRRRRKEAPGPYLCGATFTMHVSRIGHKEIQPAVYGLPRSPGRYTSGRPFLIRRSRSCSKTLNGNCRMNRGRYRFTVASTAISLSKRRCLVASQAAASRRGTVAAGSPS